MNSFVRFSLMVTLLLSPQAARADLKDDIQRALSHRIIEPQLPQQEVQDFTEARVLPLPEVSAVEDWEPHAARMRQKTLEQVVFRGEAARWRDADTKVEWLETIPGGPGYRIRKLRYEALPGLWIPALLYEPETLNGRVPVVLNVNGHDRGDGKAADYKQLRCINQAKRGMLALNPEWIGMGQLNSPGLEHYRMNQLDLCGTSGVAVHFLAMQRGLDLLLRHEHADPQRVAVAGLSGGGWQTIFISALDPRVTLSNPVAGYSSFRTRVRHVSDLGDSEQTPVDLGITADYAALTAMRAPRPTLLTFNAKDQCCFRADHALQPLLDAAQPIYRLYGKETSLRWHINEDPGTHNFGLDNRQQLYRMLGDHFYPDDASYDAQEIPSEGELKSKAELSVDLPAENATFHSLAVSLSHDLPKSASLPGELNQAKAWQEAGRARLVSLLRLDNSQARALEQQELDFAPGRACAWRIKIGTDWTLPVTELTPQGPIAGTALLMADGGRQSAANEIAALLAEGLRVLAVDPFYLGESKIAERDFLFALLVSAVGERPLGIQAAQLIALGDWAKSQFTAPVRYVAIGPRTSLMALTAAACQPAAVERVDLHHSHGSLHEIIEEDLTVQQQPEMFCFGLLEQFDVLQLAALAAPCRVNFAGLNARAAQQLAPLKPWSELLRAASTPGKSPSGQ